MHRNAATMLPPAGALAASPSAAAELFARASALLPTMAREAGGPGYRVFWLGDGALQWADVLGDGHGHLVVGRHSSADVELRGDESIALRHLVLRAGAAAKGVPELQVLDLRANLPVFVDASDEPQRSFVAEGPMLARVGTHAICALPVATCAPPKVPTTEHEASAPASSPPARQDAERRRRVVREPQASYVASAAGSHTTSLRPAPPTTEIHELQPSAGPPWVHLVVRSPNGDVEHQLDRDALRGLVLVGRYARCQAGHAGLLLGDVSRVHVGLIAQGDAVEVIDLASTNGIWVDRSRVRRGLIEDRGEVALGRRGCRIEVRVLTG